MRCVIVVPVHGRDELTNIWLWHMARIDLPSGWTVVTVGNFKRDPELFLAGHSWLAQPNQPLSLKVQAGLLYARGFEPDMVMTAGSDDFPDDRLLMELQHHIASGKEYAAVRDTYIWDAVGGKGHYWPGYQDGRVHGSFRAFSKGLLDRLDWTLWPRHAGWGLDGIMDQHLKDAGVEPSVVQVADDTMGFLLQVKGSECMTPLERFVQLSENANVLNPLGEETEQEILQWSKTQR